MSAININPADLSMPACDVCDGNDFESLARMRSPRLVNYSAAIAICRNSGFVTQRPRPAGSTYAQINDAWFSETFETDAPATDNDAKKFRKWSLMWDRISSAYPDGLRRVLDVGAGQGWAIEYLRKVQPAMEATAIERWGPCRDYIRSHLGADVVDVDPSGEWPAHLAGQFDLVILRHTLEHLNEPLLALRNIAAALAPGGAAYIVVPNTEAARAGAPMRADFFRPVHLHYFGENTFKRLIARAGLTAKYFAAEGELWGLFERGDAPEEDASSYATLYPLLTTRLAESAWLDRKIIARARLRQFCSSLRRLRPAGAVS